MGIRELHDDRITHKPSMPLADALRGEPEWLREDLWRLFEVDSTALSNQEAWKLPDVQSWQSALVELAADGAVPRDRLLDASLAALRRDFTPAAARWHYAFYEALEPTPEEHVARLDELLALLASEDPAIVGFALRVLDKLERAKRLPADKLLEAIAPAVVQPVRGTRRAPSSSPTACSSALLTPMPGPRCSQRSCTSARRSGAGARRAGDAPRAADRRRPRAARPSSPRPSIRRCGRGSRRSPASSPRPTR